jgi:hypothetical protein
MNLERMTSKCVTYCSEVANPLVPVKTLLRHLHEDETFRDLAQEDLLDFLRHHEQFTVIEKDQEEEDDPEQEAELEALGFIAGPRVILDTRRPTPAQLVQTISGQMTRMTDALYRALADATESGDGEAQAQVSEILTRAEQLQMKIEEGLKPSSD